ncbi:hypothetical protein CDAR_504521 [Caerostris darwini]|uniref:Uncharacterized protein n=1 Tax=Caerostris darwini TaxID=1538125 RepID=A0AAV4SBU2_9ARAC|nr:hypothetical protein CDAR_504521 [Caerostris darwini]
MRQDSDEVSALLEEIKRHRRVSDDSSLTAEACLSHDSKHLSGLLRDGTRSLGGWLCHWINYVLERSSYQVSALLEEIKRHRHVSDDSSLTAEACLSHDSEHPSGFLRDGTRSLVV